MSDEQRMGGWFGCSRVCSKEKLPSGEALAKQIVRLTGGPQGPALCPWKDRLSVRLRLPVKRIVGLTVEIAAAASRLSCWIAASAGLRPLLCAVVASRLSANDARFNRTNCRLSA